MNVSKEEKTFNVQDILIQRSSKKCPILCDEIRKLYGLVKSFNQEDLVRCDASFNQERFSNPEKHSKQETVIEGDSINKKELFGPKESMIYEVSIKEELVNTNEAMSNEEVGNLVQGNKETNRQLNDELRNREPTELLVGNEMALPNEFVYQESSKSEMLIWPRKSSHQEIDQEMSYSDVAVDKELDPLMQSELTENVDPKGDLKWENVRSGENQ